MTRHKHTHTGLIIPSPLDRWIDATLRVLAMLVSSVAATLQMIRRRKPVIGTQAMPSALPRETHDTIKEQQAVQQDSRSALTTASPKLQQRERSNELAPPSLRVRRFASNPRRKSGRGASRVMCVTGLHQQPWIPACAGMSGLASRRDKYAPV